MEISEQHALLGSPVHAEELRTKLLPYREQEKILNQWLKKRLNTILPEVMKRCKIDM